MSDTFIENYNGYKISSGEDAEGSYYSIQRNGASPLKVYNVQELYFESETSLDAIKAFIDDEVSQKTELEQLRQVVDALVKDSLEGGT